MTMDEIILKHENLNQRLKIAAANMVLNEDVKNIFNELKELQEQCPHFSAKHNFVMVDSKCPYCGKNLE